MTRARTSAVYTPVFFEGELVAFTAIMAHWADIGGIVSSGWCPYSTTIHQEGLIFSHLKLYDAGILNKPLYEFILKNVRYPAIVEGDLHALSDLFTQVYFRGQRSSDSHPRQVTVTLAWVTVTCLG